MNLRRKITYSSFFTLPFLLLLFSGNIQDGGVALKIEKKICYIGDIFTKSGKRFATIDIVEWLQDEKAITAFKSDHPEGLEPPPNGYYARNRVARLDTIAIADTAQFMLQTYSHDADGNYRSNEPIDFDRFAKLFLQEQYRHIPFRVVILHGEILLFNEQYIP